MEELVSVIFDTSISLDIPIELCWRFERLRFLTMTSIDCCQLERELVEPSMVCSNRFSHMRNIFIFNNYLSQAESVHELSGRESPPPEAPPRIQVEVRVAQIKLVLIGDTEKPPDLSQCQVRESFFFLHVTTHQ